MVEDNVTPTEKPTDGTQEEPVASEEKVGDTKMKTEKPNEVSEDVDNTKTEMDVVEETVENNPVNSKKDDKDSLYEEIEIPEGVSAEVVDDILIVKKDDKEIKRKLVSLLDIEVKGNKVIIRAERNRKLEKKLFGTFKAHINNMIKGLSEGFEYKLRVSNVHFPMNVSYDENKNLFTIKNFLGEKKDRIINGIPGVDVKVNGEDVIVSSHDIEKAGQVATNIEKGAKVKGKDRRIYQDGIFIIQKPGRVYLE
jgi:large subunit ribosomal protein L6|tara:strand:- start:294 stop:1049 length:756 start_codon:yes stop_codon:yes gene_type:complete